MTSAVPNPQYKTSNIISNESLMGFQDGFEFLGRVNHTYEQMLDSVGGLPTNGMISIRVLGYPEVQYGLVETVKQVEQQFETIQVSTDDIIGNSYDIDPVSLQVARNKVTDTTHYQTCQQIASAANLNCYADLLLHANVFTGDVTSTTVNADLITDINTIQSSLNIPSATTSFFLSSTAYGSLVKNITQTNTFDAEINRDNIGFRVQDYFGQPLIVSSSLVGSGLASFYPTGKALAFGVVTSTDSYKSCVITLTGGTTGDILSPGDRLQFATTKKLNKSTKMDTDQPLQLVVQNTVTAGVDGSFTGVQCICGISPLLEFDSSTSFGNWYSNVTATPATGEVVDVIGSYAFNVVTVKPGFTFCTVSLPPMQTLDIPAWASGKVIKSINPGMRGRNGQASRTAPIEIYTSFDADVLARSFFMRLDVQPVYKTFVDYNIAVLTQWKGPSFGDLQRSSRGQWLTRIFDAKNKAKLAKQQSVLVSDKRVSALEKQIADLTAMYAESKKNGIAAAEIGSPLS